MLVRQWYTIELGFSDGFQLTPLIVPLRFDGLAIGTQVQ